jgi:hypothetical protein
MDDQPLSFGHGAPLHLLNEVELGFTQATGVSMSSSWPISVTSAAASPATTKTTSSSTTGNPCVLEHRAVPPEAPSGWCETAVVNWPEVEQRGLIDQQQ